MRSFIFILSSMVSFNLFASELLTTITSDIDNNMAKLTYDFDQESNSITHLYQELYENGKLVGKEELDVEKLNHGGIVLLQKDKIVVVKVQSDKFDKEQGGPLELDTLYSGISGERRKYELDIYKSSNGLVIENNKTEFKNMKFIAKRSRMFGIIGIEKIIFSK